MEVNIIDETKTLSTITISGDLDGDSLPRLGDAVDDLQARGVVHVILDLSEMHFMSSLGLGLIVETSQTLKEKGGTLSLVCQRPRLLNEFEQTHLNEVVSIYTNLDEAVKKQSSISQET